MNKTFLNDVFSGLTAKEKYLPSKYFYDDIGSRIFQEIMAMPEYYLTAAEFEILSLQSQQIFKALHFKTPFNIIELGAGDGFKTYKLLAYLTTQKIAFNYVPIDISKEAIDTLTTRLKRKLPQLNIMPQVGDYFELLKANKKSNYPSLLLFLGSNIGNYQTDNAVELLQLFNAQMKVGDKLLLGVDLKKNPNTIYKAYSDSYGITKRFNINLLARINRELHADFKLDDFDFYCHYNPENGELKSYIISLKKQTVYLKALDSYINFDYNELIWTELSKKYSLEAVSSLAEASNFKLVTNFLDCKHYFTDSLWVKQDKND